MTTASFAGEVIRDDRWRQHDFHGQRVAVIAPGREAARIVPVVAATARAVKVFQEDPDWISPTPLPGRVAAVAARVHLRRAVRDPWRRRLLTPGRFHRRPAAAGAGYYEALAQPHCVLVTWPVYAVVADGVRTAEGIEHRVDCIVVAVSSVLADDAVTTHRAREERSA